MIRILLRGCSGRMGRMIADLAANDSDTMIAAGVDLMPADAVFPVFTDLSDCHVNADVLVDFTRADGIEDSIGYCLTTHTALLVGTTGLTAEQMEKLQLASSSIPVFRASNMSMGVALLEKLCRQAASFLQDSFDVEITETHHNQKLDAPSGTALTLAEAIRDEWNFPAPFVHGREGRAPRSKGEIGIHALRGGTIAGEHQVHFFGHEESLTLSHSAQSRAVFAAGALRAAKFIAGKPAGFYSMKDMIEQSESASSVSCADGYLSRSRDIPDAGLFQCQGGDFIVFTADRPSCDYDKASLITVTRPGLNAGQAQKILLLLAAHDIRPMMVQFDTGSLRIAVQPSQAKSVMELTE